MSALPRIVSCVVCFSALDPTARASVNAGVLTLLGVTCVVLAAFAAFILRLRRRSERETRFHISDR